MSLQPRRLYGLLLLGLSLIAASSVPTEPPPVFLAKWGTFGTGDGQFNLPYDVSVDPLGNVYVADHSNHRIQKFDGNGTFLRMWGWGVKTPVYEFQICSSSCRSGIAGSGNGQFFWPEGVAGDASGNIYVADSYNDRIQKFRSNGTYLTRWGTSGSSNGQFDRPIGVAVDATGNVYVADSYNDRIQKFNGSGTFLTKWGTYGGSDDQFYEPHGVAVDASGNVYVADTRNHRIQEFDSSGTFVLMWGWGVQDGSSTLQTCTSGCQSGLQGSGDGQFHWPGGVSVDATGNVYVADSNNHRIQKFSNTGTFLDKWGSSGGADGQFNWPLGIASDAAGHVYVADYLNHRIQKFGDPLLDFFIGEPELPSGH